MAARPRRIEKGEDGLYTVHYDKDGKEGSCRVGVVMFGTGRNPNTREIGLEVCAFARVTMLTWQPCARPHKVHNGNSVCSVPWQGF